MTNIYFTRAIQPENDHPHFLAKALIVDATGKILVLERSNTHPLFPHGAERAGDFVQVRVTQPQTWVLKGEVVQ